MSISSSLLPAARGCCLLATSLFASYGVPAQAPQVLAQWQHHRRERILLPGAPARLLRPPGRHAVIAVPSLPGEEELGASCEMASPSCRSGTACATCSLRRRRVRGRRRRQRGRSYPQLWLAWTPSLQRQFCERKKERKRISGRREERKKGNSYGGYSRLVQLRLVRKKLEF